MIKVFIIEAERGLGQKIANILMFDSEDTARSFCREYNRKNFPTELKPDWYEFAKLENEHKLTRLE